MGSGKSEGSAPANRSVRQAKAPGQETSGPAHKPLGRFSPKKPMTGRWLGILAMAADVLSLVVHEAVGPIPAIVVAAAGIYAGKRGLDSKGRGVATIGLVAGLALFLFYSIMIIVGEEAFIPPDSSTHFG